MMKIRIEITKEAAKKLHDEIQAHPDNMMMIIYMDDLDIENKIGATAYIIIMNQISHQHLENEI